MTMAAPVNAKTRYEADGFYLTPQPIIPRAVVERASAGMDAIRRGEYDTGRPPEGSPWQPGDDPAKLCKIEQPQFASRAVWDLVSHPALGEAAAAITGANMVQVWWVQLLYKPPRTHQAGDNTSVGYHQDRAYWQSWEAGSELFTAWVAVSNVRAASGPMQFVRGSHHWGLRGEGDFYEQDIESQRHSIAVPEGQSWEEVSAVLSPGGVSFHHNLTFHGSGPNLSAEPRRSFAIHLRTQNSRPVDERREGLARFIDDVHLCPVIYKEK